MYCDHASSYVYSILIHNDTIEMLDMHEWCWSPLQYFTSISFCTICFYHFKASGKKLHPKCDMLQSHKNTGYYWYCHPDKDILLNKLYSHFWNVYLPLWSLHLHMSVYTFIFLKQLHELFENWKNVYCKHIELQISSYI